MNILLYDLLRLLDRIAGRLPEYAEPRRQAAIRLVRAAAHDCKGLCGIAGLTSLYTLADELEVCLDALRRAADSAAYEAARLQVLRQAGKLRAGVASLLPAGTQSEAIDTSRVRLSHLWDRARQLASGIALRRGNHVRLVCRGGDIEVPCEAATRIAGAITHLVRNAVAHGIERPGERRLAGKRSIGRIRLQACLSGDELVIVFADDGRGIDRYRLVRQARACGRSRMGKTAVDLDAQFNSLLRSGGISSTAAVSDLAGRGMGLPAVHAAVQRMGGRLEVRSKLNRGTRFVLRLPWPIRTSG